MSRRSFAITILVLLGALPSLALGTRTFRTEVPSGPGLDGVGEMPVTVFDATGDVVGLRPPTQPAPLPSDVHAAPGDPTWIVVNWLGGVCEAHTTMVVVASERGYRIVWRPDPTLIGALGCPAVGRMRSLEIQFRDLVLPEAITVEAEWETRRR